MIKLQNGAKLHEEYRADDAAGPEDATAHAGIAG
jgi:hypothetical protein